MEDWWRDVRYGARMLLNSPGFTAVAVLTLALGIGANTAIFSVIDGLLLRPLPYEHADRLMLLTEWSQDIPDMSFSVANFKDLRDQNSVFDVVAAYNVDNLVLTGQGGEAERLDARQVTSGIFATLRKQPILGRTFTPEEDKPGADRVVLLGEGFWQRRFGGDPTVLGRTLTLSGEPFTVIGVLPGTFHGTWKNADVFTPLLRLEDRTGYNQRRDHAGLYVLGRLKPGVAEERARADVLRIARRLAEQCPESNAKQSMTLKPLLEDIVGDLRPALLFLLGAVAFVLLIACANVANLLLARAAGRQKEIAVRIAMGAKRQRLVRQLLTESLLLSALGGVLGVVLAYGGIHGLVAYLPSNIPRTEEIGINAQVLAFTAAMVLLTGLVFGIAPAWRVASADAHDNLKESGRGTVGAGHHRLRDALVVGEISLALLLLVGSGLLLRSFFRVVEADPGFRPEGLLTMSVPLPDAQYGDVMKRAALVERVLQDLRAAPGLRGVAAALPLPLLGNDQDFFGVEGQPEALPGQEPFADIARVSSSYFQTMGIRLLEGRVFTDTDRTDSQPVCIVDETLAAKYWPGESALGKRLKCNCSTGLPDAGRVWKEVVGVVAHVKNYGVDEDSRVEIYVPYSQDSYGQFSVVARATGNPGALSATLRSAVRKMDPLLPVFDVSTMDEIVSARTAQRRTVVLLISVFAGIALSLAAVGIYGVMAYAVAQRTQEIGMRMALGADPERILRMVLGHGLALAASGVGVGLVAALGLTRLMATLLFRTSTGDPRTFGIVPLLLVGVALLACYVPARRATRVNPMVALRSD